MFEEPEYVAGADSRVKDLEQALLANKHMLEKAQAERGALQADLVRVTEERNAAHESHRAQTFELHLLRDEPAEKRLLAICAERDELQRAVEKALVEHSAVESERARLAREAEQLRGERDEARKLAAEGRKAGRAEAAELLMERDAETWSDDLLESHALGDTGDYYASWVRPKVLAAFDAADSEMTSALDRREGAYWSLLGKTEGKIERTERDRDAFKAQVDALTAECESGAKAAEAKVGRLAGALAELVTLKDEVKQRNQADYERRKPAAWDAARAVLAEVKP